jgi:RHS repeat-associated protein
VTYVTLVTDGRTNENVDYFPANNKWRARLELGKGVGHTNIARAHHPSGQVIGAKTNNYSVQSFDYQNSAYDLSGFTTQRVLRADTFFNTNVVRRQALTWDSWGRLVKATERDDLSDGFDWVGTYDGLGRLLRSTYTPVNSNAAASTLKVTVDSWYDPQVEFLEIGVAVNGQRWWKVYGPDISGGYGGMQGAGGLDAVIREMDGYTVGLVNDYSGNALARVESGQVIWTETRFSGYGPVAGSPAAYLDRNVNIAEAVSWRGWRIHPMGWFYHGARWYDPNSSRYLSFDPAWEISGSVDPYGYPGDPIDFVDSTGRFGTTVGQGAAKGVDMVFNLALSSLGGNQNSSAFTEQERIAISQNAINQWGSPMRRLFGAYDSPSPIVDQLPAQIGPTIQDAGVAYGALRGTVTSPEYQPGRSPAEMQSGAPLEPVSRYYEPNQVVVTEPIGQPEAPGLQATFRAGSQGEMRSAFAKIEPENIGSGTPTTEAARNFARSLGNATDDAGHAVGNNLGGPGGAMSGNIFPQSVRINRGDFAQFERAIANEVRAGNEVYVRVVPKYEPGATRPSSVVYQVRVNGRTTTVVSPNP